MSESTTADSDKERKYTQLGKEILSRLDVEKELECPVCLIIPRSGPIFICRAGHLICFECFPKLPRNYRSRRCPICQAKYCNPPARNFIAEKLLECVDKPCRFDFQGCEFRSQKSDILVNHERQCSHKPADFHLIQKPNFGPSSRTPSEAYIVEILQACLQLCVSILAILVVLFFFVSLVSVLLGSVMTFAKTLNSCKMNSRCQLNDPNFLDLWNDDLREKFSNIISSLELMPLVFSTSVESISEAILNMIHHLFKNNINVSQCHPQTQTSLYYDWPDTYLPSHLENLIWRPGQDNVDSGNFRLVWDVDSNIYTNTTDKRYGVTASSDPSVVRAFMQWKMEMKDMPRHCQIVGVEMWHNYAMLNDWSSPLLYSSKEILVMATVTGWNLSECPNSLKFGNITWIVRFNEEACRMKVDHIPEVNMQSNYIY